MKLYAVLWNTTGNGFGYDKSGFVVASDRDHLDSFLNINNIKDYAISVVVPICKYSVPGWVNELTAIKGEPKNEL